MLDGEVLAAIEYLLNVAATEHRPPTANRRTMLAHALRILSEAQLVTPATCARISKILQAAPA